MTYEEVFKKYSGKTFGNAKFADPFNEWMEYNPKTRSFDRGLITGEQFKKMGITPEMLDEHCRQTIADMNKDVLDAIFGGDETENEK